MTQQDSAEKTGAKKPRKDKDRKKGKSDIPGSRRPKQKKQQSLKKLVENIFREERTIVENSEARKCTVFEIIILRLWTKMSDGNRAAQKAYLNYVSFAKDQPEYYLAPELSSEQIAAMYARRFNLSGDGDELWEKNGLRIDDPAIEEYLAQHETATVDHEWAGPSITSDMNAKEAQAIYEDILKNYNSSSGGKKPEYVQKLIQKRPY